MKIGFIKLGLKTYFNKCGSGQGSNHELVTIFELFKKNGHNCFMISGSDKYEKYEDVNSLDYIFMFNGPSTLYLGKRTVMLANYFQPYVDLINNTKTPYIYFLTDNRKEYKISINSNFKRKPNLILSQEKENYGHLEKIILIGQKKKENKKDIKFAMLLNDTKPKRTKDALKFIEWMEEGEIRGIWKKKESKWLKEPIEEDNVNDYLSKVKYTVNITTDYWWINQKYYEYILNDVICFHYLTDGSGLAMKTNDFRQVMDEIELEEKIDKLEANENLYNEVLNKQREEIKDSYLDGSFIYNFINDKLKK